MANRYRNYLILKGILRDLTDIYVVLDGDGEWQSFHEQLRRLHAALEWEEDEARFDAALDALDVLTQWTATTASAPYFRAIVQEADDRMADALRDLSRRNEQQSIEPLPPLPPLSPADLVSVRELRALDEELHRRSMILSLPPVSKDLEPDDADRRYDGAKRGSVSRGSVTRGLEPDEVDTGGGAYVGGGGSVIPKPLPESLPESAPTPRYLNAGFFTGEGSNKRHVPPTDAVSLDGGSYWLGVNIGKFWGVGGPDGAFPTAALRPAFALQKTLQIDIVAYSQTVMVDKATQPLFLEETGDSDTVYFALMFPDARRHVINIDAIFNGNLLQTRRIIVEVVEHAGESAPDPQKSELLFTRVDEIDGAQLAEIAGHPRRLTVVAERHPSENAINLRFYSLNTSGASPITVQKTWLNDGGLSKVLRDTRQQLQHAVEAYDGSESALQEQLTKLAHAGQSLYDALLRDLSNLDYASSGSRKLAAQLQPGTIIQVAPLSTQLSVPWELLYERKLAPDAQGKFSLCTQCLQVGAKPEACTTSNDPSVICPFGFWGFRYIIEQLPCRCDDGRCLKPPLRFYIRNAVPLQFAALVYSGFGQRMHDHLDKVQTLAPVRSLKVAVHSDLTAIKETLSAQMAQVLYFYTHGGKDDNGRQVLKLGVGTVTRGYLEGWKARFERNSPLVVLNACESAGYTPDDYESLLSLFFERGASGLIGTQCGVLESLTAEFMSRFLAAFFRQKPVGEALFEARRGLLADKRDPRGLVYSLFATADLKLAQPLRAG